MSKIKEHLQRIINLSPKGFPYYQWLLENGKVFIPHVETRTYKPYSSEVKKAIKNNCYGNSLSSAVTTGLYYVEGFYLVDPLPIPIEHAFNATDDNIVYDFTAKKGKFKVKEWFGVKVPLIYLAMAVEMQEQGKLTSPLELYYDMIKLKNLMNKM